jgi:hypothetical protein
MQVYPAYTIRKIEEELSWRILKEMMNCWKDHKPGYMLTQRIEQILMKANGMIEIRKDEKFKPMPSSQLLNKFAEKGWLS